MSGYKLEFFYKNKRLCSSEINKFTNKVIFTLRALDKNYVAFEIIDADELKENLNIQIFNIDLAFCSD
jgi:hypothetical protein